MGTPSGRNRKITWGCPRKSLTRARQKAGVRGKGRRGPRGRPGRRSHPAAGRASPAPRPGRLGQHRSWGNRVSGWSSSFQPRGGAAAGLAGESIGHLHPAPGDQASIPGCAGAPREMSGAGGGHSPQAEGCPGPSGPAPPGHTPGRVPGPAGDLHGELRRRRSPGRGASPGSMGNFCSIPTTPNITYAPPEEKIPPPEGREGFIRLPKAA